MELETLKTIISEVLGVDTREITPESNFINDLGADSLDLFEVLLEIEDKFDITINSKDVEQIATVADAVNVIKQSNNK